MIDSPIYEFVLRLLDELHKFGGIGVASANGSPAGVSGDIEIPQKTIREFPISHRWQSE